MPLTALDAVLTGPAPRPLRRLLPAGAIEFLYFGLKEARACLFAGLFFAAIFIMPREGLFGLPRYDALLVVAISIQGWMLWTGLETRDELKAICLFHAVGFALEVFKTSPAIGAWAYPQPAYTKVLGVPLFSGFMYAAVGSYIIQAWRMLDLAHPPPSALLAGDGGRARHLRQLLHPPLAAGPALVHRRLRHRRVCAHHRVVPTAPAANTACRCCSAWC